TCRRGRRWRGSCEPAGLVCVEVKNRQPGRRQQAVFAASLDLCGVARGYIVRTGHTIAARRREGAPRGGRRQMANAAIRRAFADLGDGQVHYAQCGPGDAQVVLLLHQTPRSWAEYRAVLPILGARYRAIAMDTIGFGD